MALITIAADDIINYYGDLVPAFARLYASLDFRDVDGNFVAKGSALSGSGFYQQFVASKAVTKIRISTGTAYPTAGAMMNPSVTYTLAIFDANGTKIKTVATGLKIPLVTPTTWAAIQTFSKGTTLTYAPTFYDSATIEQKFAALQNAAAKASEVQLGVVRLDGPAVDVTNPIAIGQNSPVIIDLQEETAGLAATKQDTLIAGTNIGDGREPIRSG